MFNNIDILSQILNIKINTKPSEDMMRSFSIYLLNNMNNSKIANKLTTIAFNDFKDDKISKIPRRSTLLYQFYPTDN